MLYKTICDSPLGSITLCSDGNNLIALWIGGQKNFSSTTKQEIYRNDDLPIFEKTKEWLKRYFNEEKPQISELQLSPTGNAFRQTVWQILCDIPYGEVTTYGDIAQKIARLQGIKKMSAQAVGGAIGHNPISIIIPCHRVIGANGNLTGYEGGIEKKIYLLKHENSWIDSFYVPKKSPSASSVI